MGSGLYLYMCLLCNARFGVFIIRMCVIACVFVLRKQTHFERDTTLDNNVVEHGKH